MHVLHSLAPLTEIDFRFHPLVRADLSHTEVDTDGGDVLWYELFLAVPLDQTGLLHALQRDNPSVSNSNSTAVFPPHPHPHPPVCKLTPVHASPSETTLIRT